MTRRTVTNLGWDYTIADDDAVAADLTHWAVLRTHVIDELTLEAPRAPVRLTTNLAQATTRVTNGGICGLVARPRDVAHALVTPGALAAQLEAPGFLPRDLTPAIDAARRTLTTPALSGAPTLAVTPPDTIPATQFRAGRGVVIGRSVPTTDEDFTTVPPLTMPPAPMDVPLNDPIGAPRLIGTPVAGVPVVLPDQPMHRSDAIHLRGRAMRLVSPPDRLIPAAGAEIGIRGMWMTYPSATNQPPVAPDVCAVEPGLRFSHAIGVPIQSCTLTSFGTNRQVRATAAAGAQEIIIAPSDGLNPAGGDVLRIGNPLSGEADVVVTASFIPSIDPNSPVTVRLTAPMAYVHRAQSPVSNLNISGLTAVGMIARESLRGDRVLFAAGINGLATTTVLAVEHGTARAAYYRATQLPFTPDGVAFSHQVIPDANGYFEWPSIARVAQLRIIAMHPSYPTQEIDFALDYGGDNTLTIVFK